MTVTNPHGTRILRASLVQGSQSFGVYEETAPALRWSLLRGTEQPRTVTFDAGAAKAPGIRDGKAQLVVEAISNDVRSRTDRIVIDVEVNTQPPSVTPDDVMRYFTVGGSGLVVFTAGGYWTEAGVRVGKTSFRSYALPGGGANRRAAFFALPYDMAAEDVPVVYARNPAGAEATARIRHETKRKKFRHREIVVTDAFLEKIFGELDPGGSGAETVQRFRKINGKMRAENAATLIELGSRSAEKMLWKGAFLQLAGSSVEAQFCDYRTYKYRGEKVDEQVHLGFDLATTAHAPATASNDGLVIHAGPLGIYGNAVVIDHGMGLQSLYAHLSEIGVKTNDIVRKGQGIGRTGSTGLAGGDHLHFTILVGGVPVNPVEWWDAHWLQDRIDAQLLAK
ncbi:MAG: M23 family metallopeptidase [Acidobacteria bacterium]|nr:M23 family metallopeptidase [Acidobacteriota bacterium]